MTQSKKPMAEYPLILMDEISEEKVDVKTTLELLNYIQPDVEELNPLAGSGIQLAIKALKGADVKECLCCLDYSDLKSERLS